MRPPTPTHYGVGRNIFVEFSLGLMRAALVLLLINCATASAASKYTDRMFRRAVVEDSTSPFYLLFTLHDPKTGADRVVCSVGSGLVGAIHFEHHLDFDDAGQKAARQIALTMPGHRFTFTSRKALRNVQPYYSERVLAEVRLLVARLSPGQLKRLNPLSDIYDKKNQDAYHAYRDATAHAMLERGILVYMDDRAGGVYIAQQRPNRAMQRTASLATIYQFGCLPSTNSLRGMLYRLAVADLVFR